MGLKDSSKEKSGGLETVKRPSKKPGGLHERPRDSGITHKGPQKKTRGPYRGPKGSQQKSEKHSGVLKGSFGGQKLKHAIQKKRIHTVKEGPQGASQGGPSSKDQADSHKSKDKKPTNQYRSNNSTDDNSNSRVPQWVLAAMKAGEEAKQRAAAAAAARASLPEIPNLTLAHAADASQQTQQQRQQKPDAGSRSVSGIGGCSYLDVRGRGIRTADDLSAMKDLSRIDVSSNRLLDLSFLSLNFELRQINAAKNFIQAVGSNLKELTNLRVIDLSDNQLTVVEGFDGLPNLKALILSGNEIQRVPYGSYLLSLESLILSRNQISEFEKPPQPLNHLKKLSLSNNKLKKFPFSGQFPALSELRLAQNKILEIGSGVTCMPSLTILDMGKNLLTRIECITEALNPKFKPQIPDKSTPRKAAPNV